MNFVETHVAGDTLNFPVEVPEYPNTDGWTLKYRLTARFTSPVQASIVLTAVNNADGTYQVQESPANTELWAAGYYTWARWVEKVGAMQTLTERGQLEVRPNPRTLAQGVDTRSQAAKAVDDIMAAMATFTASNGTIKSYTIGSRQITYRDKAEMITDLDFWRRQLIAEQDAAKITAGSPNPRAVGIRFHRV